MTKHLPPRPALGGRNLIGSGDGGQKARREVSAPGPAVSDYTKPESPNCEARARWDTLLEEPQTEHQAAAEPLEDIGSAARNELEDLKRAWSRSTEDLEAALADMKNEFDR